MAKHEAKQEIVVRLAHDARNNPQGERIWLHAVVKCEVGEKEGTLPKRISPDSIARHVREMKIVGEDILWLLTDRGVGVTILEN